MHEPTETYDRGFEALFGDSIRLLLAAEENLYEYDSQFSFARASIACSMLLPEVCANICIESLKLECGVFNEIDKLSPIAKFDYYLGVYFRDRRLDRGCKAVQSLQELKRLRDRYVHPKKSKVDWVRGEDDTFHGSSPRTRILDISENPQMWFQDDAVNAMRGVHGFLSYFFKDKCNYSKSKVTGLLFSEDLVPSPADPIIPYYANDFHNNMARWNIDVSYFRFGKL
ncbi:MAG: hypothetical protein V4688_04255 [Pseudomonadota bacterium]